MNNSKQKLSWVDSIQQDFLDRYKLEKYPNSRETNWRFSSPESFNYDNIKDLDFGTQENSFSYDTIIDNFSGKSLFKENNNIFLLSELKKKGVIFTSIKNAIIDHPELINNYYQKESTNLGSNKFFFKHASDPNSLNGTLIYVPKGVEIELPIIIENWASKNKSLFNPNTLIIAEAYSKITIIEHNKSINQNEESFVISNNNIFASDSSNVTKITIQDYNYKTKSIQLDTTTAEKNSSIKNFYVNLGCSNSRFENKITINGSGSHVKCRSLTIAEQNQIFDQRTLQIHNAPNSVSDLLYKNALFENSKTIFSGLIKVAKNAQQTDAYQTNRNLLLDPNANANSLPGLEILANDVKCSHGATTGNLDQDFLFYMLSRGISLKIAMQLIVLGFFEEVIEDIESQELVKAIKVLLENKFKSKMEV